ncbi:MAG TPA: hypothetical protein VEB43_05700 [Anaeromyxobacter sp.]|nr:hypothetical protein [Anaeromyxobacter sp.]
MTRTARLFAGITLLTVPTIVYGGLTVLGLLTGGEAGLAPSGLSLTPEQYALYRAGHAHAGVLVILSLVLQLLADHAALPGRLAVSARVAAPAAAIFVPGGFFGLAHAPALRVLTYVGALLVSFATLTIGVGLLRRRP